MEEVVQMSRKELDRNCMFKKLLDKELSQVKAAEILGISERQVRRLLNQFKKLSVKALISKRRGIQSNRTHK